MHMTNDLRTTIREHVRQVDLARMCKVTEQAISGWLKGTAKIPARHCVTIEKATSGAVKAEQLRPDLDWVRTKTGLSVRF